MDGVLSQYNVYIIYIIQPYLQFPVCLFCATCQVERQVDGVLSQLRPLAAGGSRLAARVRALLDGVGERPPTAQAEKFSLWAVSGVAGGGVRAWRQMHAWGAALSGPDKA